MKRNVQPAILHRLLLLVLLLLPLAATATAQQGCENIEPLLRALPATHGTFTADAGHCYGDEYLGMSRNYNGSDGTRVSIYLYNLGAEKIPDGVDSETVRLAYTMAIDDIRSFAEAGRYLDLKEESGTSEYFRNADKEKTPLPFLSARFTFRIASSPDIVRVSTLHVSGLKNYVCKIRVTWPETGGNPQNMAQLLGTLVETLSR